MTNMEDVLIFLTGCASNMRKGGGAAGLVAPPSLLGGVLAGARNR